MPAAARDSKVRIQLDFSMFAQLPPTPHQTLPFFILLNKENQARLPFSQFKSHLCYVLKNISRGFVTYLAPFPDFWAEIDSPIFKQFLLVLSVVVWR